MKTITIEIPDDCEVQIVKKEEKKEPVIRTYQELVQTLQRVGILSDSKGNPKWVYAIKGQDCPMLARSVKVAKSMQAMAMISQLMPYYGGAISYEEWDRLNTSVKYVIENINNKIEIDYTTCRYNFLAFHTPEQRDNFLKYNEQLVKDYLMIY